MKKVLLYNPALSTVNKGDDIIAESAKRELSGLIEDSYVVEVSTHLPISRTYSHGVLKGAEFDNKFVLGTNLLMGDLTKRFKQWDINFFNANDLGPAVLMGCGWWQYNSTPKFLTKKIYQKILSSNIAHSVRDEYTAERLNDCGIKNVIVTACPTMWR